MSLAAIHARARRFVAGAGLPDEVFRTLVRVLEVNQAQLLQFLFEAALEAGCETGLALDRAAGLALHLGALQLADDLADGDCDYLEPAVGVGTAAQYLLQSLFVPAMLAARVNPDDLHLACMHFARGGAPQILEVRGPVWTLESARMLAQTFGGEYMVGNLCLAWSGTAMAARAEAIGMPLGIALHVASELRSRDIRVMSLDAPARAELVDWAAGHARGLRDIELGCIRRALAGLGAN
jgi:hypothetical protein